MPELYYFDEYDDEDELIEFFDEDVKRVALYIMDASGTIEDIITDLDSIKKYIDKLYEKYPSAD